MSLIWFGIKRIIDLILALQWGVIVGWISCVMTMTMTMIVSHRRFRLVRKYSRHFMILNRYKVSHLIFYLKT